MTLNAQTRRPGALAAWMLAAVLLWLLAPAVDRRTDVVIENLGDHVSFVVDGTELVVPGCIRRVDELTLWTADSIDPPGILSWSVDHRDARLDLSAPRRFDRSTSEPTPVGDWWVDDHCPVRRAAVHAVDLQGPFEMRLVFRGRTANELTVSFSGDPTLHFGLRRGLMDNYLVVRDDAGELVDVTTIDPTPRADLGALIAQLLRAAAAACLVIALVGAVAVRFPGAGSTRGENARGPMVRHAFLATLVLAGIACVVSAWTSTEVLGGLPHQIDGVVYLLQGRWLLDGEVAPAAIDVQEHLRVPFTYLVDGRWIGHYPIGWPALLAVGLALGAPHLVSPLLGAVFVVLVFLVGRDLDDELTGLAAAALAATSPLIRLLGSTYFPHTAFAVAATTSLWLLLRADRRSSWRWGAGAGLAMGACFALRPMPAVAMAAVYAVWLIARPSRSGGRAVEWKTIAAVGAAGLLGAVPTLAHNLVVTGNPFSLPYALTKGSMYGLPLVPFGIRNLDAITASTTASLFGWGWPLAVGAIPSALALAFITVPFLLRRTRTGDLLLLALLLAVAVGHLPTRAHGLHGFGARYAVDAAASLVLLPARGFRELARSSLPSPGAARAVAALFAVLVLTAGAVLPTRLALFRGYYDVTGSLEEQLDAAGVDKAVILVADDDWRVWAESARLLTGPRRHDIAVGADLDDNSLMTTAYPDRPVFFWDGRVLTPEKRGGD